ncbi:MAG: hypothetical protein RL607_1036 [Bacteroidota bacterium]|jgi:hypothetical protein
MPFSIQTKSPRINETICFDNGSLVTTKQQPNIGLPCKTKATLKPATA